MIHQSHSPIQNRHESNEEDARPIRRPINLMIAFLKDRNPLRKTNSTHGIILCRLLKLWGEFVHCPRPVIGSLQIGTFVLIEILEDRGRHWSIFRQRYEWMKILLIGNRGMHRDDDDDDAIHCSVFVESSNG